MQPRAVDSVVAWGTAVDSVTEAQVVSQLTDATGVDRIVPLADPNMRMVGSLSNPQLLFVRLVAQAAAGGLGPHDCIVVLSAGRVVDHFCQVDAEFLPHESAAGFVALPVYDQAVTFVRLTICGEHYLERPYNDFVVFPLSAQQASSAFAAEVFRGSHRLGIEGTKAALHTSRCIANS